MVESMLTEVEIAVRDTETAFLEMVANYHALSASQAEVECFEQRWRLLAGDGSVASVLLEQLLEGQERLAAAEFAFANNWQKPH